MLRSLGFSCAAMLIGTAAFAQDKAQQPSFLPADKVYYTSECHAPFRGWVDPLRSHLVIVASSTDFRDAKTVDANLQQCLKNTSIWMTTSGNTNQPVKFELTDMTGRVLLEQTLSFGGYGALCCAMIATTLSPPVGQRAKQANVTLTIIASPKAAKATANQSSAMRLKVSLRIC